jgi:hypothetical protein
MLQPIRKGRFLCLRRFNPFHAEFQGIQLTFVLKYHAMKTYGGGEVKQNAFMTLVLDEENGQLHIPISLHSALIGKETGWTQKPVCTRWRGDLFIIQ